MTFSEGRTGFRKSANLGSLKQELIIRSSLSVYFPQKMTKTPFLDDGSSWWNVAGLDSGDLPCKLLLRGMRGWLACGERAVQRAGWGWRPAGLRLWVADGDREGQGPP